MGLYNTAWLVIEEDPRITDNRTAAFELRNVEESQSTQEPDYIMGGRGLFINQINSFLGDEETFGVGETDAFKRAGYWLDGGAGVWSETVQFKDSDSSDPIVWGDERSDPGQANVTQTDATGSDIQRLTRRQVLDYWLAMTRSDSFANTRLHIGEYTDGSYDDYRNGSKVSADAGVFGTPIPVAVESVQLTTPEDEDAMNGTLTLQRVRTFPVDEGELSDWVSNLSLRSPTQTPSSQLPDA